MNTPVETQRPELHTIVLVDDEEDIMDLQQETLHGLGLSAEAFASPTAAWERIQRGDVSLVVTDWNMPGMTGMDLLFKTRALPHPPHVILVTAFGTVPRAVQAMNGGAFNFLEKPFPIACFGDVVKDALERYRRNAASTTDAMQLAGVKAGKRDESEPVIHSSAMRRRYLSELVTSLGATPLEARDGEIAVKAALAMLPDLILLDVEMPRMDGFTACLELKSNATTARIPVVIVTSLSALDDRVHGIEFGADDFLTKPIHVPEFNARVRSLLRIKKLNDSLESAENVIFTLAHAIEAKDRYTQGHTERVTAYAVELGKAEWCSEEELTGLRQGAPFMTSEKSVCQITF